MSIGESMITKWYKVLTADLRSAHGGAFDWSEYVSHPNKRTPPIENVSICARGYHATTDPMQWAVIGMRVFEAVVDGEPAERMFDKGVWPTMRLGNECPEVVPAWWRRVEGFVAELPSIPWLCPQGDPGPEWRMFEPPEAARYAARCPVYDAAWSAVWGATRRAARDTTLYSIWGTPRYAAWDAASDGARDVAWDEVWGATRRAVRDMTWDAARDIVLRAAQDVELWARVLVCADLPLAQRLIDHARERMEVWRRGFWLLGYEHGIPYVCRGPSKGRRHDYG